MNVTAICERSGGWWAVAVPEVEGAFTQTKRLDQVPAMVADAVSLLADVPADQVHVAVQPRIGGRWEELRAHAKVSQDLAMNLQAEAAIASRAAVADLRGQGLPVRDVATLLGISPQRVSQLAAEELPADELPADERPHVYTLRECHIEDPEAAGDRLDGAEAHAPHPA